MAKPIFILELDKPSQAQLVDIVPRLERRLPEYYVLVISSDKVDYNVLNADITPIQFEELKAIVEESINPVHARKN